MLGCRTTVPKMFGSRGDVRWDPPLPVATLAVLVVKIGVKKFCNCPV
jgi:hypothetical protein